LSEGFLGAFFSGSRRRKPIAESMPLGVGIPHQPTLKSLWPAGRGHERGLSHYYAPETAPGEPFARDAATLRSEQLPNCPAILAAFYHRWRHADLR
jgi:hypothetical protein